MDRRRLQVGARARARHLRPRPAPVREVHRPQRRDPRNLQRRASDELEERPAYLRLEGRRLYAASGRRLGTLDDVPLHTSELDHVYRYSDRGGRARPHDIALTSEGRPRIVYTRRVAGRDTFYYAYHNGTRWISRRIVEAGPGRPSFHSGGALFDHADPRIVYLSRTIGPWNQVEQWFTPDSGRTWTHRRLTNDPQGYAIRPVVPRGHTERRRRMVYVWADERTIGYTDYTSRIHALDF